VYVAISFLFITSAFTATERSFIIESTPNEQVFSIVRHKIKFNHPITWNVTTALNNSIFFAQYETPTIVKNSTLINLSQTTWSKYITLTTTSSYNSISLKETVPFIQGVSVNHNIPFTVDATQFLFFFIFNKSLNLFSKYLF
jgi:hypothetical protein